MFIIPEVLQTLGGLGDHWVIMEDFDFFRRMKRNGVYYTNIKWPMTVYSGKYKENSWLKVIPKLTGKP